MSADGDESVQDPPELSESDGGAFRRLLDMLYAEHRFDVREYKTASLVRRIRGRMSQARVEGFETYIDYLRLHPQEAAALFNAILINVTGFFRDPEAWNVVRREVVPSLIEAATASGRLRIWSAGCSTGEEPYSAAILLADALGDRAGGLDVKIYATEIDDEALVIARQGLYRIDQVKDVPGEILERYFTREGHLHRVRSDLRRWCIFGRHNLVQDPPLPHISLLLCRNVLIYFRSELQERLLPRFHYALREGGFLFLGRSEALMSRAPGFVAVNQRWRIFRRSSDIAVLPEVNVLRHDVAATAEARAHAVRGAPDVPRVTAAGLARAMPYPVIMIDADDTVLEWNAAAAALYEIPSESAVGRSFRDLDISYRAEGLRARIEDVKQARGSARLDSVVFSRRSGEGVHVDFWVARVHDDRHRLAAILVAAWDGTAMTRFRDEIVRLGEQHATATEELQSTNEELETTNEELQSTNEELETTNEELQSTNEELLATVDELQSANSELAARSRELRRLSLSHASIVNSVGDAVVVLDDHFTVTAWNAAAASLLGVPAADAIGRDFFQLPAGTLPALARPVIARLAAGTPSSDVEFAVDGHDGARATTMRLVRIADAEDALQGIVGIVRGR